ncbi:MAG: uroporphyrinogen-III synthase [Zoogloeaceae bacterium]|jgi:uroporphyrinogen-III synthase|nr:uroporphyrinogen-III synthase [Zoogloeaceae bacterium]
MPVSLPLAERTIVVTRPREQAQALADGIRERGGTAYLFPLLAILPHPDPAPLQRAAALLPHCRLAIFISANAVRHALPALSALIAGGWPKTLRVAATGPGTARALAEAGLTDCLLPALRFDSEGLLALPELEAARVAGQEALIFRGDGGRELLAETLAARGANVHCVPVYQRVAPVEGRAEFLAHLAGGHFSALTLSSSEALRHLLALFDTRPDILPALRAIPLFTPHPRIAEKAHDAHFRHVLCTPVGDDGLLAALSAYNWQI